MILLNGPPGIGKSTLAGRYVDDHPLALNLDIDSIRASMGQWERHDESKRLARSAALEMARAHLGAGHEVVVPQLLCDFPFIEALNRVATEAGAAFVEVLLMDGKGEELQRFRARRAELETAGVTHPQREIDPSRDSQVLSDTVDRLTGISRQRPGTQIVHTTASRIDEAYRALREVLDG